MKASLFRRVFVITEYDKQLKVWFCYYKNWLKSMLVGEGKTPEAARADLIEKIRHETIPNNRR